MKKKKTALITGASSGIGYELAKIMASEGHNLILTARRKERLEKLKKEIHTVYDVRILPICADLTHSEAPLDIYNHLKKKRIRVDFLINNAGLGKSDLYQNIPWKDELEMMQVNMIALTSLTKLFLKDMLRAKDGRIMNIASTAAFQPGPLMATYYATKAFVLSYSEAISYELRNSGVSVTAYCPGPTATEFNDVSRISDTAFLKKIKKATATDVAKDAYQAMMKSKSMGIHGLLNKKVVYLSKFMPRKLVQKFVYNMHK